jgi:hypothetical protein
VLIFNDSVEFMYINRMLQIVESKFQTPHFEDYTVANKLALLMNKFLASAKNAIG